ncbi:hypothetical protein HYPBUDRAFT_142209 [Hyphopichia burtonii NRRL Y-1933]|uniref:U4/U6.U5 small nuclear ribonucleoprotein 27kDa protein domain-containing protein n=1 Tax=Hyphopichia burtonii NRRL Y-1933 TaxID=984485 RepID=A0A1E4RFL4_9ASCO|nr:hypothetical protein HYPBUDRAFT_142209 [Hyphopichia burtonii NRRL Y-1933]ODV66050.1 hypothetical protein HYPBUDRAFT_142209 [Hyphopichia burtonii NRRL Y-1933]
MVTSNRFSSRSRSRSPAKSARSSSPIKPGGLESYRERSTERSIEKQDSLDLFTKETASKDGSSLGNGKKTDPKHETESRGRSRDREILETNADEDMISLMGFGGFGSTKGKHVTGTKGGNAKFDKKSDYRQYINREKGFNRPLSPNKK